MSNKQRLEAAWQRYMALPKDQKDSVVPYLFGHLKSEAKSQSKAMAWMITELEAAVQRAGREQGGRS
jgi:hypothetical protein